MTRRVAALLLLILLVSMVGCNALPTGTPSAEGSGAMGPLGPENGEWHAMAEPPESVAWNAPVVWTGRELVSWGGGAPIDEGRKFGGASYDPVADDWTDLPRAPLDPPTGHTAVWSGREILYWGGSDQIQGSEGPVRSSGVAYNPRDRTWRPMAAGPLHARAQHEAIWTGREMIVWGGIEYAFNQDSHIHHPSAAAYDPDTDTWRRIADVPPPWSGDGGSVVMVEAEGDVFVWRHGALGRYRVAEDRWERFAGKETSDYPGECAGTLSPVAAGAVVGDHLLMWWGGCALIEGIKFSLASGSSVAIAPSPHLTESWARLAGAADGIFATNFDVQRVPETEPAVGRSVWRYDVKGDVWSELPKPPVEMGGAATPVWTGRELVVLPGLHPETGERSSGAVFRRR